MQSHRMTVRLLAGAGAAEVTPCESRSQRGQVRGCCRDSRRERAAHGHAQWLSSRGTEAHFAACNCARAGTRQSVWRHVRERRPLFLPVATSRHFGASAVGSVEASRPPEWRPASADERVLMTERSDGHAGPVDEHSAPTFPRSPSGRAQVNGGRIGRQTVQRRGE